MKSKITLLILIPFLLFGFRVDAQKKQPRFGKISKEEMNMKVCEFDTSANAAVIFKYGDAFFQWSDTEGFQYVLDVHIRIKIFNKEGFDYADVEIPYSKKYEEVTSLKAASYNTVDGKTEKTKLKREDYFSEDYSQYTAIEKFTFPHVKEGTVLEYEYRIISDAVYSLRDWEIQDDIPVLYNELMITIPEYYTYRHNQNGYLPIRLVEENNINETFSITVTSTPQAGGKITRNTYNVDSKSKRYIYLAENVPAFKEEPYITTAENYISSINFELQSTKGFDGSIDNYTTDWGKTNEVLMNDEDFGRQIKLPRVAEQKTDEILAGAENEEEKITRIYSWLTNNIAWNGKRRLFASQSVREILNEKSGSSADINLLLIGMLKHAGIHVQPLVLSTRDNGFINPAQPSVTEFNYVIAYVKSGDNKYFLDATEKYLPAGLLPERCINGYSRLLGIPAKEIHITGKNKSTYVHQLNLELKEDKLVGTYSGLRDNIAAFDFRKAYIESASEEKFIEDWSEKYPGLKVNDLKIENLNDYDKSLRISYHYDIEGKIDLMGNMIYFNPMIYWGRDENPFKSEERNYPVDYTYPFEKTYILMFTVPEGYEVESLPESQNIALPDKYGSFMYSINQMGSSIQLSTKFTIESGIIPQTHYGALKQFYSLVVKKLNEQIVLKKV